MLAMVRYTLIHHPLIHNWQEVCNATVRTYGAMKTIRLQMFDTRFAKEKDHVF